MLYRDSAIGCCLLGSCFKYAYAILTLDVVVALWQGFQQLQKDHIDLKKALRIIEKASKKLQKRNPFATIISRIRRTFLELGNGSLATKPKRHRKPYLRQATLLDEYGTNLSMVDDELNCFGTCTGTNRSSEGSATFVCVVLVQL